MKKRLMRLLLILLFISLIWIVFAQSCMRFRTSDSTAYSEFKAKSIPFVAKNFDTAGHTIHYVVSGEKGLPVIIFIHGSPGSWDAFKEYMQDSALLQKFCMIGIDRPGFGYSDFGDAMDLDKQAKFIAATIYHEVGAVPITLVGHSLGGPLVVKLAAEFSQLNVKNLVILAGSVDPDEEKPENWRIPFDRTALRYFVPGAMRPSNAEILLFKTDVLEMPEDLAKVHCNVLIMHGDKDDFVPPANAVYAKEHLKNATNIQLVWFKGQNHFIPWTKFKEIRDALLQLPA